MTTSGLCTASRPSTRTRATRAPRLTVRRSSSQSPLSAPTLAYAPIMLSCSSAPAWQSPRGQARPAPDSHSLAQRPPRPPHTRHGLTRQQLATNRRSESRHHAQDHHAAPDCSKRGELAHASCTAQASSRRRRQARRGQVGPATRQAQEVSATSPHAEELERKRRRVSGRCGEERARASPAHSRPLASLGRSEDDYTAGSSATDLGRDG